MIRGRNEETALNPAELGKKRMRREGDSPDSHRAQLLWTFSVAMAVAASALFQVGSTKAFRVSRDPAATLNSPEVARSNRRASVSTTASRSDSDRQTLPLSLQPERENDPVDSRPGVFSE